MWVKALTAEESLSSLQLLPLGPQKPFMFVFDLKGKYTPEGIYMFSRPLQALEAEHYVRLGLKPPLMTNTVQLHFEGNRDH